MLSSPIRGRGKSRAEENSFSQVNALLLTSVLCLSALLLLAAPIPSGKPAYFPGWWFSRGVIVQLNPASSSPTWPTNYPIADDYTVVNQGQLKNIATQAYNELQARLPSSIWSTTAGETLTTLITEWNPESGDAYAVVNLGQLKALAKPFYDVLAQSGYPNSAYPWTADTDDWAAANIGQVKNVFSFDLSLVGPSNLSATNGSGGSATLYWTLPATNYATNLVIEEQATNGTWTVIQTLTNPATVSDTITNLVEGQNYTFQIVGSGTNTYSVPASLAEAYHSSYYGGVLPNLTYVSGNGQNVQTNTYLPNPLVIKVTNSSGSALASAPITFSLAPGSDGGLSATNHAATNYPSVSVLTSPSGYATNYYESGPDGLANNVIVASAYAGSTSTNYNFTAYCGEQTDLSAWYRADSGVTTNNGSIVTNWTDYTGHGNNLTNTIGTNAPTLGIDPTTGKPVVQFNGSQFITRNSVLSGTTNVTFLIVTSTPTPSTSGALMENGTSTNSPTKAFVYANGNQAFVGGWSSGTPVAVNGGQAVQSGALSMNTVTYSNTNSLASFYCNGVANGTAIATNGASGSGIRLGSLPDYNTNWNGNIAEAIFYNNVLTTAERQEVELYLAKKYSIPPAISSPTTASGTVGVAFSGYTITASNGPTSYGVISGTFPNGLSVNSTSGAITGTPTAAGTSSVVIRASSAAGTGTAILTFTIYPASAPVITNSIVASGVAMQPFQFAVTASNNPTSYSISSGTLPTGLSLNTTTGSITGTPSATTSGTTVTVKATNAYGSGTQSLTVIIGAAAPTITGSATLAAWFNADTGVTTTNGQVAQWNDHSSNTNNVSAAYPNMPTLTNDPASGNSVVNFNGNQILNLIANTNVVGSTNDVTIVTAAGTSAPGSGKQTQVVVGNIYGGYGAVRALAYDNGNQSFFDQTGYYDGGPASVSPNLSISTVTYSTNSGTASFYSQGVTNSSVGSISANPISPGLAIGGQNSQSGSSAPSYYPWSGNIGEVLVYNGVLTTTQRQSVETYLADKYGIYTPNADWINGYTSTIQGEINRNRWSKAQTDAYLALQTNNPGMLTTGLKLWLRADAGVTLGAGPNVRGWTDQTGNYSLSQTDVVYQPTLVTNDCNGEPGIRFNNGTSGGQFLTNTASIGVGVNADMTMIAVGMTTTPSASPEYSISIGNGTSAGVSRALGYNNSSQYFNAAGGITNTGTNVPPANTFVSDGASLSTNSPPSVTFYRNGTPITGSPSTVSTQAVTSGISVGSAWQGDICEVLLYDHQLNPTTELPQVSSYLANKYGLYYTNASWITNNFSSSVQAQINTNQWNENQAEAYVQEYTQVSNSLPVINGLTAWFKADSGVITNSAGQVTTWKDSSWNGNDVTQTSPTNQPILTNDPGTGMPTIQFGNGGTVRTNYLANVNNYSSINDVTIIAVASNPSPGYDYQTLVSIGQGQLGNNPQTLEALFYRYGYQAFSNGGLIEEYPYPDFFTGGSVGSSTNLITSAVAYAHSANTCNFYLNGVTNGSATNIAYYPISTGLALGSIENNQDLLGWTGNISEVLIYNRALSSTEIGQLQTYITNKYIPYPDAAPTISVSGTNSTIPRTVTLGGATSPAIIEYTLNGSTPATNSTQYTGPFSLYQDTPVHCAIFNSGTQISPVATNQVWVGDTYGIGIPDAWQTEYFGTVTNLVTTNLVPGGSGLTYMQAYQSGYNPTTNSTIGDGVSDLINYIVGYGATDTDINGYVNGSGVKVSNSQQLSQGLDPFDIGVNPLPSAPLTDPGDTNPPTITLTQPLNAH